MHLDFCVLWVLCIFFYASIHFRAHGNTCSASIPCHFLPETIVGSRWAALTFSKIIAFDLLDLTTSKFSISRTGPISQFSLDSSIQDVQSTFPLIQWLSLTIFFFLGEYYIKGCFIHDNFIQMMCHASHEYLLLNYCKMTAYWICLLINVWHNKITSYYLFIFMEVVM